MSAYNLPDPSPNGEELLSEIQLGDALGDDESLFSRLIQFDSSVNEESPGTSARRTFDLMAMARSLLPKLGSFTVAAFQWGVNRFTDHECKLIQARAKAEKEVLLAKSEAISAVALAAAKADKIRAEAGLIRGKTEVEVEQGLAIAEGTRLENELKREMTKKLRARKIDWQGEMDDGVLRIVVTKGPTLEESLEIDPKSSDP